MWQSLPCRRSSNGSLGGLIDGLLYVKEKGRSQVIENDQVIYSRFRHASSFMVSSFQRIYERHLVSMRREPESSDEGASQAMMIEKNHGQMLTLLFGVHRYIIL